MRTLSLFDGTFSKISEGIAWFFCTTRATHFIESKGSQPPRELIPSKSSSAKTILNSERILQCHSVTLRFGRTQSRLKQRAKTEAFPVSVSRGVYRRKRETRSDAVCSFGGRKSWARLFAWAGRVRYAWRPAATRTGVRKPVAAARPPARIYGAITCQ